MKTLLSIPTCDKCGDVANVTIGTWFWGHGCVCGGQYQDRRVSVPIFARQLSAQAALANKGNAGFCVRATENGWWALVPTQSAPDVARHTPGPWSNTPMQDTIWANDGEVKVAKVWDLPWINGKSDWMTEDANARLIAAAPTMFKALQSIIRVLDGSQPKDIPGAIMAAQYAIRVAQGVEHEHEPHPTGDVIPGVS